MNGAEAFRGGAENFTSILDSLLSFKRKIGKSDGSSKNYKNIDLLQKIEKFPTNRLDSRIFD